MKSTILLTIFAVLIATDFINAQFPRRRKLPSDVYKWTVDIDSGNTATQKAVSLQSKDAVIVFTYGKAMKEMNLTGSSMLMEFTEPSGVMVVRFGSKRKGICFLIPTSDTLDQIKTDLTTRNGTTITLSSTLAFNGTADPLTKDEATSVIEQHPVIKNFCFRAPLVETSGMTLGDEDTDTKTVTVLGFDTRIALMLRGGGGKGSGEKPEGEEKPKRPRFPKLPRFPNFPRFPRFPRRG